MTTTKEPFFVHCGDCSHEWAAAFLPMSASAFARLARASCPKCASRRVLIGAPSKETTEGDPIAWLTNGDTGISSKTIWSVLMSRKVGGVGGFPWDPADFGRCYRLLKVMPSWRARLPEVSAKYPAWASLVNAWDELTVLYEEELPSGSCPKLYHRMQDCVRK